MTNAHEIKNVFRPLVERHKDLFVLRSRALCVRPVRHIALKINIEPRPHHDFASPQWGISDTFRLNRDLVGTLGSYTGHLFRNRIDEEEIWRRSWRWSSPSMVGDLIAQIEDEVLPFLRCLNDVEQYKNFCERRFRGYPERYPEDRLIVDTALGNLDAARGLCLEMLSENRSERSLWWMYGPSRQEIATTLIEPLMAGDRKALAAILHGWETQNIRGTKLEPHWEPSPFPLEMM